MDGKEIGHVEGLPPSALIAVTTASQAVAVLDRRVRFDVRKKVSEMTPDEMRVALLTSDKTGLGNERCYVESVKKTFQASIDVDSLGWINDNMGHLGGDHMLSAVGQAFIEETGDAFHLHGDEFAAQFDSEEVGHEVLARVRERLKGASLTFTTPNGVMIKKIGIGLSYGIDKTFIGADAKLYDDKAERTAINERVKKGQEPAGVFREPSRRVGVVQCDSAGTQIVAIVFEGFYCGRVLGIADGVVTQKINRAGDTVRHDASKLFAAVQVDDVIEVLYRGGKGEVKGVGRAAEVDR